MHHCLFFIFFLDDALGSLGELFFFPLRLRLECFHSESNATCDGSHFPKAGRSADRHTVYLFNHQLQRMGNGGRRGRQRTGGPMEEGDRDVRFSRLVILRFSTMTG